MDDMGLAAPVMLCSLCIRKAARKASQLRTWLAAAASCAALLRLEAAVLPDTAADAAGWAPSCIARHKKHFRNQLAPYRLEDTPNHTVMVRWHVQTHIKDGDVYALRPTIQGGLASAETR